MTAPRRQDRRQARRQASIRMTRGSSATTPRQYVFGTRGKSSGRDYAGAERPANRAAPRSCLRIGNGDAGAGDADGGQQDSGPNPQPVNHATGGARRLAENPRYGRRRRDRQFPGAVDSWTVVYRPAPGGTDHSRRAVEHARGGLCPGLRRASERSRRRPFHRNGGKAPRARARFCPCRGRPRHATRHATRKLTARAR